MIINFMIYFYVLFLANYFEASETNEVEKVFNIIYEKNPWGSKESISGNGSTIARTDAIRKYIPELIKRLNIRSILDAPCGDFNWMKTIINELNIDSYLGIDIVERIINNNNQNYSSDKIKFSKLDIINNSIPKVDLIICRDCLQHLSFKDIIYVLKNFKKSGSTFLLVTTFTNPRIFSDINTGSWRPINFQLSPFNFVDPLEVLQEKYVLNQFNDKSCGLWKLEDINIPEYMQ